MFSYGSDFIAAFSPGMCAKIGVIQKIVITYITFQLFCSVSCPLMILQLLHVHKIIFTDITYHIN